MSCCNVDDMKLSVLVLPVAAGRLFSHQLSVVVKSVSFRGAVCVYVSVIV